MQSWVMSLHLPYFNSIKVRLEQEYEKRKRENRIFQFHKGTIRTRNQQKDVEQHLSFQFHKGTIRTPEDYSLENLLRAFQFHKGTIKTQNTNLKSSTKKISIP